VNEYRRHFVHSPAPRYAFTSRLYDGVESRFRST